MPQLETFAAYFGRLVTLEDAIYILALMGLAFLVRKPIARRLGVSIRRYLLIALAFAGIVGLSLRFWEWGGINPLFWLVDPALWAMASHVGTNWILNVALYVPPALLLVLAAKNPWKVFAALVGLSFVIETIQQYTRIGAADPADLIANLLGAGIGVALGLVCGKIWPRLKNRGAAE